MRGFLGAPVHSYKREERNYAFAVRQWLIDAKGWRAEDIFVDVDQIRAGDEWETRILAEAESADAMLFLASDHSLNVGSFCYRELEHTNGQILAVTIKGVKPDDARLQGAIPSRARSRQITALDREPTRAFEFVSPLDNTNGSAQLNVKEIENITRILRDDFGIAPDSFSWTPTGDGPYPGLRPLMEGDEALFFGRDIEIRSAIKALEEMRESVSLRALYAGRQWRQNGSCPFSRFPGPRQQRVAPLPHQPLESLRRPLNELRQPRRDFSTPLEGQLAIFRIRAHLWPSVSLDESAKLERYVLHHRQGNRQDNHRRLPAVRKSSFRALYPFEETGGGLIRAHEHGVVPV